MIDSSYSQSLSDQSYGFSDYRNLIHFSLITDDSIIDIIDTSEPEVTIGLQEYSCNIKTFVVPLLYKQIIFMANLQEKNRKVIGINKAIYSHTLMIILIDKKSTKNTKNSIKNFKGIINGK